MSWGVPPGAVTQGGKERALLTGSHLGRGGAAGHGQATAWDLRVDSKALDGSRVLFGPQRLTLPVAMVRIRDWRVRLSLFCCFF